MESLSRSFNCRLECAVVNALFYLLTILQAWLRKQGLASAGNKSLLTNRVEGALRKKQDDLLQEAKLKKPKNVKAFEFESVSDFVVGGSVIFVSKEMDGSVDTSDEYALLVVTVTKVSFIEPEGKGKDEEMLEEERVIEFSILDNGKSRLEEAPVSRFFQLPAGPLERVGAMRLTTHQAVKTCT